MDKKLTILISVAIIAAVIIGLYLAFGEEYIPESSQLSDLFDYSIEPTTNWNENKKEYSFSQTIKSVNGKDYKDIGIRINFYKSNELIGSYDSTINATKDGKFNLKFTKKLSEEPDAFYYDITGATEV